MTITPSELLDTSIAQLQVLVAFLKDQLGDTGASQHVESGGSEVRACREVVHSLSTLIPQVEAARRARPGVPSGVRDLRQNVRFFAHHASAGDA